MSELGGNGLPHLILPDESVVLEPAEGWRIAVGGEVPAVLADGAFVEGWDAAASVKASRCVRLAEDYLERLGLVADATTLRLRVLCETGRWRSRVVLEDRELKGPGPVDLELTIGGQQLCRDLALTVQIVLGTSWETVNPLAADVSGARLWEQCSRYILEGGKARLPMAVASFGAQFPQFANALFHVELAPEATSLDLESALLVYLNGDVPGFVEAVEQRKALAEVLLWGGVIRRVLASCIEPLEDAVLDELPPNCLGRSVMSWVQAAFGEMSLSAVKELMRDSPSEFEARLEAGLGRGREFFEAEEKTG